MSSKIRIFYILFIYIFSICFFSKITAQGVGVSGSLPVNLYTGAPNVQIPLLTLPHPIGTAMDVSISYNSGGHKVQGISGPIGLGWNLNVGGSIQRVVKGLPDDFKEIQRPTSNEDFRDISERKRDGEYDLFYFNFLGRSGKFIYSGADGEGFTIPYQDLQIERSLGGVQIDGIIRHAWIIKDEYGNEFVFGNTEVSRFEIMDEGNFNGDNVQRFVSKWNLVKIVFANSPDEIEIEYVDRPDYSYLNYNAIGFYDVSENEFQYNLLNTSITVESPQYIDLVTTPQGSIKFSWSNNRKDIGSAYLERIKLLDHDDICVTEVDFNYSYFDSKDAIVQTGFFLHDNLTYSIDVPYEYLEDGDIVDSFNFGGDFKRFNQRSEKDRLRLCLRSININGSFYRNFNYSSDNPLLVNSQGIKYNPYALPPRDGTNVDFHGFANDKGLMHPGYDGWPTCLFPSFNLGFSSESGHIGINGKSIYPSAERSKSDMLVSVEDDLGGFTIFEFEGHFDESESILAGGVRVKSVERKDSSRHVSLKSTIHYKNPQLSPAPQHFQRMYNEQIGVGPDAAVEEEVSFTSFNSIPNVRSIAQNYVKTNSLLEVRSNATTEIREKPYITYAEAEVVNPAGLKETTVFYSIEDNPDVKPQIRTMGFFSKIKDDYTGAPYIPYTDKSWQQGIIKKYSIKSNSDAASGFFNKEFDYRTFNTGITSNYKTFKNWKARYLVGYSELSNLEGIVNKITGMFGGVTMPDRDDSFIIGEYHDIVEVQGVKEITETYLEGSESILTKTTYNYHPTYKTLPTSVTRTREDFSGETYHTRAKTFYVSDYEKRIGVSAVKTVFDTEYNNDYDILDFMENEHMIGVPIMNMSEVSLPQDPSDQFGVASLVFSVFKEFHGQPKNHKSYEQTFTKPRLFGSVGFFNDVNLGALLLTTIDYDPHGLVSSVLGRDGLTTRYEYDDHGYLTSEILDTGVPDLNRQVSYTYKPLVGIETMTDHDGKTISYQYDHLNRLYLTKDHNEDILERRMYSSLGQGASGVDFTYENDVAVNKRVSFKVSSSPFGKPEYLWDFGDGTFQTTRDQTIVHTYSGSEDFYLVKVKNLENTNKQQASEIVYAKDGSLPVYLVASGDNAGFDGGDVIVTITNLNSIIHDVRNLLYWEISIQNSSGGEVFSEPVTSNSYLFAKRSSDFIATLSIQLKKQDGSFVSVSNGVTIAGEDGR